MFLLKSVASEVALSQQYVIFAQGKMTKSTVKCENKMQKTGEMQTK